MKRTPLLPLILLPLLILLVGFDSPNRCHRPDFSFAANNLAIVDVLSWPADTVCDRNDHLDYRRYQRTLAASPERFLEQLGQLYHLEPSRLIRLARDPDHQFLMTNTSILEVVSILEAKRQQLITGEVERAAKQLDFITVDPLGNLLMNIDVKTPPSLPNIAFRADHTLRAIQKKLRAQDPLHPTTILLDISFLNPAHRASVQDLLRRELTPQERAQVTVVCEGRDLLDFFEETLK